MQRDFVSEAAEYRRAGKIDHAIDSYRNAIAAEPECHLPYLRLAELYVERGELDPARELLIRAVTAHPDFAEAYHLLGDILLSQAFYEQAATVLEYAAELEPGSRAAHLSLGKAFAQLGRLPEAERAFSMASELDHQSAEPFYLLGEAYFSHGDLERAITCFRRGLELQQDYIPAMVALGRSLQSRGQRREAQQILRTALGQNPREPAVLIELGEVLFADGKFEAAEQCFREAVALDDHDPRAVTGLIKGMEHRRDWTAAEQCAREYHERHGDSIEVFFYLIKEKFRTKNYREAYDLIKSNAGRFPDVPALRLLLVTVCNRLGYGGEARANLLATSRRQDLNPSELVEVAELFIGADDFPSALSAIERAIASEPKNIQLQLKRLRMLLDNGESPANVNAELGAVIAAHGMSAPAVVFRAELLVKQGNFEQAAGVLKEYLNRHPRNCELRSVLANVLSSAGMTAQAVAELKENIRRGFEVSDAKRRIAELTRPADAAPAAAPRIAESSYIGTLESVSRAAVRGWAVCKADPKSPVPLELRVNGVTVAAFTPDERRSDIEGTYPGAAASGFTIPVPSLPALRGRALVSVVVAATGETLRSCPQSIYLPPNGVLEPESIGGARRRYRELLFHPAPADRRIGPAENAGLVSIVISHSGDAAKLTRLLHWLRDHNTHPSIEVLVAADESDKEALESLRGLPVAVLSGPSGECAAERKNRCAYSAGGDYLLFIDSGIRPHRDFVGSMMELLADPRVGAVGAKFVDDNGRETAVSAAIHHLGVGFPPRSPSRRAEPAAVRYQHELRDVSESPWRVPACRGEMMMCRADDFRRAGGFDKRLTSGSEDVAFCLKIRAALGKEVINANHLTAGLADAPAPPAGDRRVRPHFRDRYGWFVQREARRYMLDAHHYWSGAPLRVGFAVLENVERVGMGDLFTAQELGRELARQFGWEVYYLESSGDQWYDVEGLDAIISMGVTYDLFRLTGASPALLKIGWVRNRADEWAQTPWVNLFDGFWCSSSLAQVELAKRCSKPSAILPIATAFDRFSAGEFKPELFSDYCFTGNHHGCHRPILHTLQPWRLPFDFAVYGFGWESIPEFRSYHRGRAAYDSLPDIYASTKIVIDDAWLSTGPWGSVNSRVFDALAAGALVLTNNAEGSRELFGGKLPVYSTASELEELLWRYLSDDRERCELAAELRRLVSREHTYALRARQAKTTLRPWAEYGYRIVVRIGVKPGTTAAESEDYAFAQGLCRALERMGHRSRIEPIDHSPSAPVSADDVVIVLRGPLGYRTDPAQLNIAWLMSHPGEVSAYELRTYDHVFVASVSYAEELSRRLERPVDPLLSCTDPALFYPDPSGCENPVELLYAGNSGGRCREMVRLALDARLDFTVFGRGWDGYVPRSNIAAERIEPEQLRRFYSRCGAVLCDHDQSMRDKGMFSPRLFDAAACGALIISNRMDGLAALFGESVRAAETPEELAHEAALIRDQDEAAIARRLEIADMVRSRHTFDDRAAVIIRAIDRLFDQRKAGLLRVHESA